jgi:hypothetical protein
MHSASNGADRLLARETTASQPVDCHYFETGDTSTCSLRSREVGDIGKDRDGNGQRCVDGIDFRSPGIGQTLAPALCASALKFVFRVSGPRHCRPPCVTT